jgi:hypothetical protein
VVVALGDSLDDVADGSGCSGVRATCVAFGSVVAGAGVVVVVG